MKRLHVLAITRPATESAPLAEVQRSAFARVYEENSQAIYRYLLARVGRGDLAEELTAQTFLAALQGFPSYRGTGKQLAWLIGIARRKAVDEHRHYRRERPLEDARSVPASDSESPDRVVLGRLASERVLLLLQRSTPERREAVSMRLFGGLTARETAALMGKSEAAVKMLVHRALRELQAGLSQEVRDV